MNANKFLIFGMFLIIFSGFVFSSDFSDSVLSDSSSMCSADLCFSGGCRTVTLTPKEVQSLFDNFLYNALKPAELVSGEKALEAPKKDATTEVNDTNLEDCPEINIVDNSKSLGVATKIDCRSPNSVDMKDAKYYDIKKGDFTYAMILTESMRIAKCEGEAESDEKCSVAAGLQYSNSSSAMELFGSSLAGILPDVIADNLPGEIGSDSLGSDAMTTDFKDKNMAGYKEEFLKIEKENKEAGALFDSNEIFDQVKGAFAKTFVRSKIPALIPNHIKTKTFNVQFQDVCSGDSATDRCRIYIYSFFDRYYNSYYSGTILASIGGPQIWGMAKKKIPGFTTKLTDKLAKTKIWLKGGYEKVAVNSAEKIRLANVYKGMKPAEIKEFEKLFAEGSPDKLRQAFEQVEKNLVTPEQKIAFADYLKNKSLYATQLKAEVSALKDTPNDAVERLLAQSEDNVAPGLGVPITDLFWEKNGQYAEYMVKRGKTAGDFVDLTNKAVRKDALKGKLINDKGEIMVGKMTAGAPVGTVLPTELTNYIGKSETYIVHQPGVPTNTLALTDSTLETVKGWYSASPTGVPIFKSGTFTSISSDAYKALTKEMQSGFIDKAGIDNIEKIGARSEDLLKTMYSKNLINKNYWNPMQWALFNEKYTWSENFFKKIALMGIGPEVYWMAKTSDSSPLKGYFIGEREMSDVSIYPGSSIFYDDSYVDIFANEEFSSGDYFGELIISNAGKVIEEIAPAGEFEKQVRNLTGVKSRDDVEDLVFWTTSQNPNENCFDCASSAALDGSLAEIITYAVAKTTNYILEMPDPSVYEDKGLSLAVFGHHTNIDFNITSSQSNKITDSINIEKAIINNETCVDAVKTSFFGKIPYIGAWFESAPARTGLVVGILDQTAFYATMAFIPSLSLVGGAASMYLIDHAVMAHFEGCVDSEEGYYVHYTHRFKDETLEKQTTLSSLIGQGTAAESSKNDPEQALNKVNKAVEEVKDKFMGFIEKKDKEFLQIKYSTDVESLAKYSTGTLWLAWAGPRTEFSLTGEDKQSIIKAKAKDANGNEHELTIDKRTNTISFDNKEILRSELVGLASKNGIFGGYEIPMSTTFMPADIGVDYFQIMPNGEFRILDASTEMCALEGARKQTGFTYSNIMEYTGLIETVHTRRPTSSITLNNAEFNILGGLLERQSSTQGMIVDSNVHLVDSLKKQDFGTFSAINFKNALMIYRETEKDFALWIKIIAQINARDVQKFSAEKTKIINPETGCEETAFNLSLLGNQSDLAAKAAGEKFDAALQHAGPYQYFETEDKIIMFYSKKDDSGECKEYMKVIDKKTGKVEVDAPIASIEQTDTGFNVKTTDGQTHSLEFSSENGRPFLTYDGKKSALLMAQGRNGSMYFNKDTGNWTVANSQMLPFSDGFANEGWLDTAGVTKPGGNPVGTGTAEFGKKGTFNIPLFEGLEKYLLIIMSVIFASFAIYYLKFKE